MRVMSEKIAVLIPTLLKLKKEGITDREVMLKKVELQTLISMMKGHPKLMIKDTTVAISERIAALTLTSMIRDYQISMKERKMGVIPILLRLKKEGITD